MTAPARTRAPGGARRALRDAWIVARRNTRVLVHTPVLVIPAIVQPVVFLVMIRFVFGGVVTRAAGLTDLAYIDVLAPAAIFITAAFGMAATAAGVAADVSSGMVERLRALPMSRSGFLAGRVVTDTGKALAAIVLIAGVAVGLGYRPSASAASILGAMLLALGAAFAFTWVATAIGIALGNPEAAPAATLMWLFPLTFCSSAFVPISTFGPGLQRFAEINPVTHFIDAIRLLTLEVPAGSDLVPTTSPIQWSVTWIALLTAVAAPLAVRTYRRNV